MDGEAVIVHLGTGNYYSLDNSGGRIWNLLLDGASPDEITALLCRTFTGERDDIARAVNELLDRLRSESLIVPADRQPPAVDEAPTGTPLPFEPPVLHTYTDMQELLLLDPIHEVDTAAGWPHRKDESTDIPPGQ